MQDSKGTILVTDTVCIFDEHVQQIEAAGYEVVRIDKPDMTEGELCEAVVGKTGYILGGIEYVTDKVFDAAKDLKAIVFTGTGYQGHVAGWRHAQELGIHVGYTPYANANEVAEWGVAITLAMQRDLFALGPQGDTRFHTVTSLPDLSVGVIGLGHIGALYADMLHNLGAKDVSYWNRSQKTSDYTRKDKDAIFAESDIIFVAVGDDAGKDFISEADISRMKQDALIVSIAHQGIVNEPALSDAVSKGKIRAALDDVADKDLFKNASSSYWYASNASAASNSTSAMKRFSDMATDTILNLLETGEDQHKVR